MSRIWEMKDSKYAKTLAEIQVTAILLKREMQRNFLPKFIEICRENSMPGAPGHASTHPDAVQCIFLARLHGLKAA